VTYKIGDLVVYAKAKVSAHPTPRAENVHPASAGEEYTYTVEKYWIVTGVPEPSVIEVMTRRGKRHRLRTDDPLLRKANFFERTFRRGSFPSDPSPPPDVKPKQRAP